MNTLTKNTIASIVENASIAHLNLSPAQLIEHALKNEEGKLADNGSFTCDTGKFTGRSPEDRFIVLDQQTENTVGWGDINKAISKKNFDTLYDMVTNDLKGKELYVRYMKAGADPKHQIGVKVINTLAWHNLFAYNMFIRPEKGEAVINDFTIICHPKFEVENPEEYGLLNKNFAAIDFTDKILLIAGTAYSGEMKKGIFSVLNYILPLKGILSMHCAANIGKKGDTAVFFGLSGTGKTTLSTDPERLLIGDDEHGWTEDSVFNFEGGCYAKVIDLNKEHEPDIWNAIRFGAIVENTRFHENTRTINYADASVTQNTRVSYPIYHIDAIAKPSVGGIPKNIFFLTADRFGIIPPISRLSNAQAMYHFLSGYTAKVAGTEVGVTKPRTVFSACFGEPFMPLHPVKYAELLGKKLEEHNSIVWLINTGWTGGAYGEGGNRMSLPHTRALITAAMNGWLDNEDFTQDPVFGFAVPKVCTGVPSEILQPRNVWKDKAAYDKYASDLAKSFHEHFKKYAEYANEDIRNGAPLIK